MNKETKNGIRYEHVIGTGVIKAIDVAEIPNAAESDDFVNITFAMLSTEGESGTNGDFETRATALGIDASLLGELSKGINTRTCTCLVNLANFPNIDFEELAKNGTQLPFTAVYVSVKSMLEVLHIDGTRVRKNDDNTSFASTHKRGFLGFVDDVNEQVLNIFDRLKTNLENGDYVTDAEETEEETQQPTQNARLNRRR